MSTPKRRILFLLVLLVLISSGAAALRYPAIREWWLGRQSLEALQRKAKAAESDALIQVLYGEKLYAQGKSREAMEAFVAADRALARTDTSPLAGRVWARLGFGLAQAGADQDANRVLEQARKIDSNNPWVYLGYALMFMHRQMLDGAEKQLNLAINIDPKNADALYLLGKIANDTKKMEVGADYLRRAVALRPNEPAFQAELGNSYAYQSKFTEAIEHFRRAYELEKDSPDYKRMLGAALAMGARTPEKYQEAANLLADALKSDPNNPNIVYTLGQLHLRFNGLEEAQKYLKQAIAQTPNNVEAWYNLGLVEQRLGNAAEAARVNAEFQRLSKQHEATVILEKKVSAQERNPQWRQELARQYRTSGNIIGAYWQYRIALQLKPDLAGGKQEFDAISKEYGQKQSSLGALQNNPMLLGPPPPRDLPMGGVSATNAPPTNAAPPTAAPTP